MIRPSHPVPRSRRTALLPPLSIALFLSLACTQPGPTSLDEDGGDPRPSPAVGNGQVSRVNLLAGPPGRDFNRLIVQGINGAGTVVGLAYQDPYVAAPDSIFPLAWPSPGASPQPVGDDFIPWQIDDAGTMVGVRRPPNQGGSYLGSMDAFWVRYPGGRMVRPGGATCAVCYPLTLKMSVAGGFVVGVMEDSNTETQLLRWNTARPSEPVIVATGTQFQLPGFSAVPIAVNSQGSVAYTAGLHAQVLLAGASGPVQLREVTGATETWVFGLNDHGMAVGRSRHPIGAVSVLWNRLDEKPRVIRVDTGGYAGAEGAVAIANDSTVVGTAAQDIWVWRPGWPQVEMLPRPKDTFMCTPTGIAARVVVGSCFGYAPGNPSVSPTLTRSAYWQVRP
ncbi:MAG: hypothetical protein AB7L66_12200 [Gemmatimonadales bacterium]